MNGPLEYAVTTYLIGNVAHAQTDTYSMSTYFWKFLDLPENNLNFVFRRNTLQ